MVSGMAVLLRSGWVVSGFAEPEGCRGPPAPWRGGGPGPVRAKRSNVQRQTYGPRSGSHDGKADAAYRSARVWRGRPRCRGGQIPYRRRGSRDVAYSMPPSYAASPGHAGFSQRRPDLNGPAVHAPAGPRGGGAPVGGQRSSAVTTPQAMRSPE